MAPKRKSVIFKVKGKYGFPFDMLRYDQAWPTDRGVTSLSAVTRGENRGEPEPDNPNGLGTLQTVEIELQSNSEHAPTTDRWHSFGWIVTSVESRSY